ncbi:MAG: sulfide/dihydroorotate dehydrogenase-like FAD/NAD-binding protein [Candidatus Theseobacter exili]|nr:sulfide/dihydroorotate dehydrogenase-like FAD/NAD-binding protein [Candidatus Theseobacter exili]
MKKSKMFTITNKEKLADKVYLFEVNAPRIAKKAEPGQFVIVRQAENSERIPLTIADFDRKNNSITLVVLETGYSTSQMAKLTTGNSFLDIAGPLGHPSEIPSGETVLMVAGGLGIAPVFPIARKLKNAGNKVISIIGARNKDLLFWQDRMGKVSDELLVATDDGSLGHKGFVTDLVVDKIKNKNIDRVFAIGPGVMMNAVARVVPEEIELTVSLNALMVDGTGMCGGCRVSVGGETKFTCVDGPEFNGHKVDFEEFLMRHKIYKNEEEHICKLGKDLS